MRVSPLLPSTASSAPSRWTGVRRRNALCTQINDDDAGRLEAVREQRGDDRSARGFSLTLLDHLQRVLVGQPRDRIVAERERGGQSFDQFSLGRFLLVALGRARVWNALDDGAVGKLVVGLM